MKRRELLRGMSALGAAAVLAPRSGHAASGARTVAVVASERHRLRVVELVRGLERPWGLAFLPDGRMLVSERPGRLRLIAPGAHRPEPPLAGLPPIWARGQGGLLDVALDPEFGANRRIYFSYSALGPDGLAGTRVARAVLAEGALRELEVIFVSNARNTSALQFGSRLAFDRAGHLYITVGDRRQRELAQDLRSHAGKVVRLWPDGRVPQDNPFVGRDDAAPEVFTYGHRNPQGLAREPESGEMWLHEHGPQGGDEVNVLIPGANYGWPVITYGREYGTGEPIGEGTRRPDVVDPLKVWTPSIAPSGMAFCDGRLFPGWRGDLLVGALRAQSLVRLPREGRRILGEERLLVGLLGRIRDVRLGPEGAIYLLTDRQDGGLYRIEPA